MSTMPKQSEAAGPVEAGKLAVEYWDIGKLIPYARNARTHSGRQVAEIAGSIRAFGFSNPILVGEAGDVIAGHGRLAAARQLGMQQVPVIILRELNETQRRQLVLADNRIALNAGWDMEMLKLELAELAALAVDLSTLGFTQRNWQIALTGKSEGLTDEDEIPPIAETAISKTGDIWCLGPHRIACGDSTDPELIAQLLAGQVPALMVTDPPYGVEYDPAWRHRAGSTNRNAGKNCATTSGPTGRPPGLSSPARSPTSGMARCRSTIVAESLAQKRLHDPGADHLGQGAVGDEPRGLSLAARTLLVRGAQEGPLDRRPEADDAMDNRRPVDRMPKPSTATQKPVECMRRPILNNSNPGQAVYEPFLGQRNYLDRRAVDRSRVPWRRTRSALRRRRHSPLAGVYRGKGGPEKRPDGFRGGGCRVQWINTRKAFKCPGRRSARYRN